MSVVESRIVTPDFYCPLCGDLVERTNTVWRDHDARRTHVRFEVCANCQNRSLCPASYHGVHSDIIDDIEEGGDDEALGHCEACRAEFIWRDGAWRDMEPPPIAADINALNARLQNGDLDLDGYVRELTRLAGIEGNAPVADGESKRKD